MHRAACPPRAPCVARSPHLWCPAPAAKYTYIDAFNGKTVTRETLLRYTFKSSPVNILIRGNLWKILPLGFNLTPARNGEIRSGIGVLACGGSPRYRSLFLSPRHTKTSMGHGRVLLGDSRSRRDRIPVRHSLR